MLAPINYLLDNKSPMDSFVGGMGQIQGLRANDLANDNAQHVNTQYGLQNEAMAAKQQRQAQFEQEVDALDFTNMQDLRAFAGRYDDIPAIKGVQEAYKQLDDTKKQAMLGTVSRAYAATSKGRPEVAIADLRAQAEAYRNTGDESMAKQAEDMAYFLEQSPEAGLRMLGIGLGAILPKDASDSYANVSKAFIGEDDAPVNRAKVAAETGKVNTEAVIAASDGLSAAAMVGDPELFKQKVDMFARAGAIPVEHADYLDALMKLPQEQAILALENYAKGNPEIAKAIMVSDSSKYTADKGYEGTVYSSNNSLTGTQYVADKTFEGKLVDADTKRYAVDVDAETKRYGIDKTASTAEKRLAFDNQQAALKANEAELKEAGGKMYFVNKKGEIYPALDETGQHIVAVSKKRPPTESQTKDNIFGSRMEEANKTLARLEKGGTTRGSILARAGAETLANVLPSALGGNSAEQQQYLQAQRDFINAILRRESGAAIAESEFENARKQYFPQVGDSEGVIKQKTKNRELVTNKLLQSANGEQTPTFSSGKGGSSVSYGDLFN